MNDFIKLKTCQGLSLDEIKLIIRDKKISIWGTGHLGRVIKRSLERNGILVKSFCDNNSQRQGSYIEQIKVISPEKTIDQCKQGKAFIIIASSRYRDEMEKECVKSGLIKKTDYLNYISIPRPEAAVDVAGICNLKCPSCPQGNMSNLRTGGVMKSSVYKKVLKKLISEFPMLAQIDLSTWGEPFMNPELAKIVAITEKFVPCTISTNLQKCETLEEVVKAHPSQILISVSGCGKCYEQNHAGASWPLLLNNMALLKSYIKKYKSKTEISVLYHVYVDNQKENMVFMKKKCAQLGYKFVPTWAYLNPYENFVDFCKKKNLGSQASRVLDKLPWKVQDSIDLARHERGNPCLCQRIFPIINWDLSVCLCHVCYGPVIAKNYLDISFDDLLKIRHNQPQCKICQKYGLHRLDIEVLLRKYNKQSIIKMQE